MGTINQMVDTQMDLQPGPVVLGLVLDMALLSRRSSSTPVPMTNADIKKIERLLSKNKKELEQQIQKVLAQPYYCDEDAQAATEKLSRLAKKKICSRYRQTSTRFPNMQGAVRKQVRSVLLRDLNTVSTISLARTAKRFKHSERKPDVLSFLPI